MTKALHSQATGNPILHCTGKPQGKEEEEAIRMRITRPGWNPFSAIVFADPA